MNKTAYQPDIKQNVLLAALAFAAGSIPLPVNLNSIALILLVFASVLQQPFGVLKKKLAERSLWMIPAIYFLWLCCTYFWDATGGFSIRDIERYAMLFFIPPALAVIPRIPQRSLNIAGAVFIGVTTAVCIGCLVKSYQDYQIYHDARSFYYHYLSQQMGLNAIFLSNYCLASITWLLYYGFVQNRKVKAAVYIFIVVICVFLFGMILLLASKLILFLTLLILIFLILYIGYLKKHFFRSLIVVVLFMAAGITGVSRLGYLSWRISTTSIKQYKGPEDNNNGLSIRMLMWHTAWDLVKQRPLLGYGVKGGREKVVEKYKEENFLIGYQEGYHSHDQYLQSALMGGLPAFLLLMAMLLKMGWEGIRKKNILLLLLLLHFMCQSVIESTFEVQQELVFYMLFLFLFYYHPVTKKINDDHALP